MPDIDGTVTIPNPHLVSNYIRRSILHFISDNFAKNQDIDKSKIAEILNYCNNHIISIPDDVFNRDALQTDIINMFRPCVEALRQAPKASVDEIMNATYAEI